MKGGIIGRVRDAGNLIRILGMIATAATLRQGGAGRTSQDGLGQVSLGSARRSVASTRCVELFNYCIISFKSTVTRHGGGCKGLRKCENLNTPSIFFFRRSGHPSLPRLGNDAIKFPFWENLLFTNYLCSAMSGAVSWLHTPYRPRTSSIVSLLMFHCLLTSTQSE